MLQRNEFQTNGLVLSLCSFLFNEDSAVDKTFHVQKTFSWLSIFRKYKNRAVNRAVARLSLGERYWAQISDRPNQTVLPTACHRCERSGVACRRRSCCRKYKENSARIKKHLKKKDANNLQ